MNTDNPETQNGDAGAGRVCSAAIADQAVASAGAGSSAQIRADLIRAEYYEEEERRMARIKAAGKRLARPIKKLQERIKGLEQRELDAIRALLEVNAKREQAVRDFMQAHSDARKTLYDLGDYADQASSLLPEIGIEDYTGCKVVHDTAPGDDMLDKLKEIIGFNHYREWYCRNAIVAIVAQKGTFDKATVKGQ